ncbi:MAG: phosphoribosyl-AMP cyclohydrolase, partial [Pseudomonadota bacterium]
MSFDLNSVKWTHEGLLPAIAQAPDGTVLMMAWMNRAALDETLSTGQVTYWSRSRQALWR